MSDTPVLFLIFNRPDVTQIVFDVIAKVKPQQLFVAADGPRKNKSGEKEKCEQARKIVVDQIDWECDVKLLFRENNLGCKYAVSSAINWFFQHVEAGIILEDDCLPDPTFFNYCGELLVHYKNNKSVMHISGNYFNRKPRDVHDSYFFSRYLEIWGWATWRRAWKLYDVEMKGFEEKRKTDFLSPFKTEDEQQHWMNCFINVHDKNLDTWDYQWVYSIITNKGMGITPYTNLVSNIGFRNDATHTTRYDSRFSQMITHPVSNIIHPKETGINLKEDAATFKRAHHNGELFAKKVLRKVTPHFVIKAYHFIRGINQ